MKKELVKIPQQLSEFSRIGPVYLVGGSLRDRILHRPSNDHDFAVPGDAGAFAQKVAAKLGTSPIVLGKGNQVVFRVASDDDSLDFSPLQGRTIEDDLKRRDFTVNALGLDLGGGRLIDPVGGLNDIRSKTIRVISEEAIKADPLRMVRAFRLGAVLGFDIAPDTLSVIKKLSPHITRTAGERIRSELMRMMDAGGSFPYLKQMFDAGLLIQLFPELEPCAHCPSDQQGQSVLHHVLRTYQEMESLIEELEVLWPSYVEPIRAYLTEGHRNVLLKWAAMLHDIGKPQTHSVDDSGKVRFLAHEEKGALLAKNVYTRLRMSAAEQTYLELIIGNHLHPLHLFSAHQEDRLTAKGLIRFVRKYQDHVVGLLLHSVADQRAKTGHDIEVEKGLLAFFEEILRRYFEHFKPAMAAARLVTGRDLIEQFGLSPSVQIGRLLQTVEEARLSGEVQTREEAIKLVARLLELEGDAGIEPATPSSGGLCSIR